MISGDIGPGALIVAGAAGTQSYPWRDLAQEAAALAPDLQRHTAAKAGATNALIIATSDPVPAVTLFLAAGLAGALPILAPSPRSVPSVRWQSRLTALMAASGATTILVQPEDVATACQLLPAAAQGVLSASQLSRRGTRMPRQGDFPFLQFTSGTTAAPRGFEISPAEARASADQAAAVYGLCEGDISCNWVPLYHDMGFVTSILWPLTLGYDSVVLRPQDFVAQPLSWLQAIHAFGATFTSAPNFALDLAIRRHPGSWDVDLSTLRVLRLAAEPVRADTLLSARRSFHDCGLETGALCPSYGLAEATLLATSAFPGEAPRFFRRAESGNLSGEVASLDDLSHINSEELQHWLADLGSPAPGTTCRIRAAEPKGQDHHFGTVEVSGPQVAKHFWAQGRRQTMPPSPITGDLGALVEASLCIVGRADEAITFRGQTYHLAELERLLATHVPALRPGRIAISPARDADALSLTVLAEARLATTDMATVRRDVTSLLTQACGAPIREIQLLAPRALLVTTSGKVRRMMPASTD